MSRRAVIGAVVALAAVTATSCTRTDPLFCDDNTPCTDPARPFCDLAGEFPASDGIGKTCIADPNDGAPDAGLGEPDAAQLGCNDSSDCSGTTPICDALVCRSCATGGECAAKDPAESVCLPDGSCAECGTSADCADPDPICDADANTCRPCGDHGECASGVCDLNTGLCAAAADLIYVNSVDGTDGLLCGDGPDAAACATIGGALGGLVKVTATRKYVILSADSYVESITVAAIEVFIVGTGALNDPFFLDDVPSLSVLGGADVTVDGLTLQGADGVNGGVGLNCIGSSVVRLYNVTLQNNELGGLRANACSIEARSSAIRNNQGFGLSITNGRMALLASTIEQNDRAGLEMKETEFAAVNNFIVRNGSTFLAGSGGVFIENSALVASSAQQFAHNTVSQNESGLVGPGLRCETKNPVLATSNIVHGNNPSADPVDDDIEGNCDVTFSDVEGLVGGTGNIDIAPSFVAPVATPGDFHLLGTSAGIDVANPAGPLTVDFDGDPRPGGAGFDMGADEAN